MLAILLVLKMLSYTNQKVDIKIFQNLCKSLVLSKLDYGPIIHNKSAKCSVLKTSLYSSKLPHEDSLSVQYERTVDLRN